MSVLRQQNWLQQQRVDVPHLRALESAACADFDLLAGSIMAGSRALVVQGFDLVPASPGTVATSLQLHVANGVLVHPLASETGSIFNVPSTRAVETLNAANARVSGSFAASSVNYVGVDLRRTVDASTTDLVQFLDANTLTEKPKSVPLARTLDYLIVITTQDFSANTNVAPLAKVTTDAAGNVLSIEDARNLMYRLGSGGSVTNARNAYTWPSGRTETGTNSDFNVGDKIVTSLKTWMDAAMTRMWETGGGEFWYSPTADRNVHMVRGFGGASVFTGGEYFEWSGTNLHWKGLAFIFDNSTGTTNQVADQTGDVVGLTNLADGDCIYVDLDRTANKTGGSSIVAVKGTLLTLGTPTVPGARHVIAWRSGSQIFTRDQYFAVGTAFVVATPSALGMVKLTAVAGAPAAPVVPSINAANDAQAQGLSRGAIGAGTLSIGTEANDTAITVGKAGALTTFPGNLATNYSLSSPFGDGSDGSASFNGVATVLGLAPSTQLWNGINSHVYTLTRDMFFTDLTLVWDGAIPTIIETNGFRVYGTGTLTCDDNSTIGCAGGPGGDFVTSTPGAAGAGGGKVGTTGSGGDGTIGRGVSTAAPAAGTNVTTSLGGAGGAASTAGGHNLIGAGGTVTGPPATAGSVHEYAVPLFGYVVGITSGGGGSGDVVTQTKALRGGGGGAAGGGGAGGASGGGGGGGGVVAVAFRVLNFTGANTNISAPGGAGGLTHSTSSNAGGGGGGLVLLVYSVSLTGTPLPSAINNAVGGAHGTGSSDAASATNGANGTVVILRLN